MKLLLDECIDRRLANALTGHDVKTVHQMGWTGQKDKDILSEACGQFDAFVTVDQNLPFQQNLSKLPFRVLILKGASSRLNDLLPLAPLLLSALGTALPGA